MGRSHGPYGLPRARRHQVRRHGLLPEEGPDLVVPLRPAASPGSWRRRSRSSTAPGSGRGSRALLGLRKEWRRILATAPLLNYVRALPRILKK
ncbi:MAG: hypothetical protein MZW92_10365 [Comamonadaceae bacterium]|nr:hypothetical protein [Comamonadaceae bacterium]